MQHHHHDTKRSVRCAVITVSDTRTKDTDKSGQFMIDLLEKANHEISFYEIISDDRDTITGTVQKAVHLEGTDAVLINGGTGISQRDVTIEAVQPLLEKEAPGFGELFRYLSYELDIGSKSMLSRAICGTANQRIIFCTPGSSGAVKLAMEKLILPEIGHAAEEVKKDMNK